MPALIVALILAGTLVAVAIISKAALLGAVVDALYAGIVLVPGVLAGVAVTPWLLPPSTPMRWRLLVGSAVGIGSLSIIMLLLGCVGLTDRTAVFVVLTALLAFGMLRRRVVMGTTDSPSSIEPGRAADAGPGGFRLLWLLVAPFLVLSVLAATTAPGLIWQEEGFGYDALEYHLQVPREYLDQGGITYLPHNVYANFPANVEMLYLLGMIVVGDPCDAGTVANMIHLLLGALCVLAAWVAGRERSPRAGVLSAVAVGTVGWMPYLSGLAYVELGMLFFGFVATAAVMRAARSAGAQEESGDGPPESGSDTTRWLVVAGIASGLACGCKYTAVPMIALPLGLAVLLCSRGPASRALRHTGVFAVATLAALAPWLVKNLVMTGNPVFPLANSTIQAAPPGWGPEETTHWNRGHTLPDEQTGVSARLKLTWNHIAGDKYRRFGPAIFLLAIIGAAATRRRRTTIALTALLVVQFGVWLFATHLLARFAVVLLIPLALLAGCAAPQSRRRLPLVIVLAILIGGSLWNLQAAVALCRREVMPGTPPALFTEGRVPGYEYLGAVNRLPPDARVLMVGEARAFYVRRSVDYCVAFNRNPFFEQLRGDADAGRIIGWLQERGYTHVLVNWSEVARLAGTYGFAPPVDAAFLADRFDKLTAAGLTLIQAWQPPGKIVSPTAEAMGHPIERRSDGARYVELYAVP